MKKVYILTEEQLTALLADAWVSGSHDETEKAEWPDPVEIPSEDVILDAIKLASNPIDREVPPQKVGGEDKFTLMKRLNLFESMDGNPLLTLKECDMVAECLIKEGYTSLPPQRVEVPEMTDEEIRELVRQNLVDLNQYDVMRSVHDQELCKWFMETYRNWLRTQPNGNNKKNG